MTDALRKVRAGDRFRASAGAWNAFIDAAKAHRARQADQGQAARPQQPGGNVIVPARNVSGSDQNRFAVLGIDGPVFTPDQDVAAFTRQVSLDLDTPDEDLHVGRFAVLAEPIASGGVGLVCVQGVCPARIHVEEEPVGRFADVSDGISAYLTAGDTGGAFILWRAGGTGEQWALVALGVASPIQPTDGAEYQLWQLHDDGGVMVPVWDWARMHE